jgi:hypothetical protein
LLGIGTLYEHGHNLSDDGSCNFGGTGSLNNATLNLGALAYHDGGSTQTHWPGVGSVAIGRIPYGTTVNNDTVMWVCNTSATDQNGMSRPRVSGGNCSGGAVEVPTAPRSRLRRSSEYRGWQRPLTGHHRRANQQTITVRNAGNAALNLIIPPATSAGFTAGNFASTTITAGGSTTFTLTCNAAAGGSPVSGTVSFNNNDGDENPFNFTVTCTVNPPLLPPTLHQPENGTLTKDNTPSFAWDVALNGLMYRVQVDDQVDFSSPAIDAVVNETTYTATAILADARTYSWRVQTIGSGNLTSSWSAPWSFTIDSYRLAAPTLISPKDRSGTPDQTPTLSWGAVSGAKAYQVQWSSDPLLAGAHEAQIPTLTYTPPAARGLLLACGRRMLQPAGVIEVTGRLPSRSCRLRRTRCTRTPARSWESGDRRSRVSPRSLRRRGK